MTTRTYHHHVHPSFAATNNGPNNQPLHDATMDTDYNDCFGRLPSPASDDVPLPPEGEIIEDELVAAAALISMLSSSTPLTTLWVVPTAAAAASVATIVAAFPDTAVAAAATTTTTETAVAAGPISSAVVAWLHFVGIMGVTGGLVTERFVIKYDMSEEEESVVNTADGIYGLSAFSLLVTGYFQLTQYGKGFDFYKNEPIFWFKMASVAVLGGLSFFPAIIFFRRDQARRNDDTLPPLSDAIIDRISTILNAELTAIASIPLMASLMARGVGYVQDFPWAIGVVLYAVSLGGAGYKYGKEAFDIMESENALVPLQTSSDDG